MYSFSVYSSPVTFPFCFAVHTWVVLESPIFGQKRYEVRSFRNKQNSYFYTNATMPDLGSPIFMIPGKYYSKKRFYVKKIFRISGGEARKVVENIESQIQSYPFSNIYKLYPGPNSNTFTRWILNLNQTTKNVQLPWNAFGKSYFLGKECK